MSLADELLADLEEGGDALGETETEALTELTEVEDVIMETDMLKGRNSVRSVAKLRDSDQVLQK